MKYQNVGTMDLGMIGQGQAKPIAMDAAGIASGQAFLTSELEKRDPIVRTPLTSFTYARDLPIRAGGGWAEFVSAMDVSYGVTGGSGDEINTAAAADGIPMVQADFGKGLFKTHMVALGTRVFWVDQMRGNMTGRNMDSLLRDGVRMTYDKHMDENAYVGFARYGTTGLLNNPDATVTNAANVGTVQNPVTAWEDKTPDQILKDVNDAIIAAWAASEYDQDAIPNHILIPYEQYNYVATTKVSQVAEKTILTFLLENNLAKQNGVDLFIGGCRWCDGAGVGGADRMVVYVNKERFIAVDELVPLTRAMTTPNAERFSYDTAYAGNISEVELFYDQSILYVDGI